MSDIEKLQEENILFKQQIEKLQIELFDLHNRFASFKSQYEFEANKIKKYFDHLSNEVNNLIDDSYDENDDMIKLSKAVDLIVKYYGMDIISIEEYDKLKISEITKNFYIHRIQNYNNFYG